LDGDAAVGLRDKLRSVGRVAEPAPPTPPFSDGGDAAAGAGAPDLSGFVQIRHVDAGSCNGCEIEISQAFSPVYDAERHGARLVASPRHADALLVTGPVTRNMAVPLTKTYEAMPRPRRVIAVGDCARDCGVFAGGYGVAGAVADFVPVDVQVAGCPPHPQDIAAALQRLTGRSAKPEANSAKPGAPSATPAPGGAPPAGHMNLAESDPCSRC
jgi:Ni,Fe-hydrogenase III small subunit